MHTIRSFRLPASVAGLVIATVPFHAFLSVWAASLFGHYTALRLWKEYILAGLVICCLLAAVRHADRRRTGWPLPGLLPVLTGIYILLLAGSGLIALGQERVTPLAFWYGLLLDSRYLVFFAVVWFLSSHSDWILRHWRRLVLWPAAAVIGFGLLQFLVLPPDFLTHFGYGPATIDAVQTVDEKDAYQRIQSTLRGANPLGAYLVVVLSALGTLLLAGRGKDGRNDDHGRDYGWYAALFAATCLVLGLTFSRSAWIGAVAAMGWLILQSIRSGVARRWLLVAGCTAVLLFAVIGYGLRDNDFFQNTILHTDENSQSATSSNQERLNANIGALSEVIANPLGGGTGTAGPASVYNDGQVRISENYYLQIGQEAGVGAVMLFVAINLLVARSLWLRREHLLPRMLLAALIGISLINLLSHAWTDDTLAYVWWGLAGAAMALPLSQKEYTKHKHEQHK